MVDEILARVGRFRHGPLSYVLVTDVAVEIDHRRHHGLARELDARRSRRDQHVTAPSHYGKPVILDDKGRVLDGVAIARDEARSFENRDAGLTFYLGRNSRHQKQTQREQPRQHVFCSAHGSLLSCSTKIFLFAAKRWARHSHNEKLMEPPLHLPVAGERREGADCQCKWLSLNE